MQFSAYKIMLITSYQPNKNKNKKHLKQKFYSILQQNSYYIS